jgi:hypothetical protein
VLRPEVEWRDESQPLQTRINQRPERRRPTIGSVFEAGPFALGGYGGYDREADGLFGAELTLGWFTINASGSTNLDTGRLEISNRRYGYLVGAFHEDTWSEWGEARLPGGFRIGSRNSYVFNTTPGTDHQHELWQTIDLQWDPLQVRLVTEHVSQGYLAPLLGWGYALTRPAAQPVALSFVFLGGFMGGFPIGQVAYFKGHVGAEARGPFLPHPEGVAYEVRNLLTSAAALGAVLNADGIPMSFELRWDSDYEIEQPLYEQQPFRYRISIAIALRPSGVW